MSEDIRLILSVERSRHGGDSIDVTAYPVQIVTEDGQERVRNITESGFDPHPLANFRVNALSQIDPDSSFGETYGWTVEYREAFSVKLDRAEVMVKTLRKVNRGMEKLAATYGRPTAFSAYLAQVASVLGISVFGRLEHQGRGYSHDDNEYRWSDASSLSYWLSAALDKARKGEMRVGSGG